MCKYFYIMILIYLSYPRKKKSRKNTRASIYKRYPYSTRGRMVDDAARYEADGGDLPPRCMARGLFKASHARQTWTPCFRIPARPAATSPIYGRPPFGSFGCPHGHELTSLRPNGLFQSVSPCHFRFFHSQTTVLSSYASAGAPQ